MNKIKIEDVMNAARNRVRASISNSRLGYALVLIDRVDEIERVEVALTTNLSDDCLHTVFSNIVSETPDQIVESIATH